MDMENLQYLLDMKLNFGKRMYTKIIIVPWYQVREDCLNICGLIFFCKTTFCLTTIFMYLNQELLYFIFEQFKKHVII